MSLGADWDKDGFVKVGIEPVLIGIELSFWTGISSMMSTWVRLNCRPERCCLVVVILFSKSSSRGISFERD